MDRPAQEVSSADPLLGTVAIGSRVLSSVAKSRWINLSTWGTEIVVAEMGMSPGPRECLRGTVAGRSSGGTMGADTGRGMKNFIAGCYLAMAPLNSLECGTTYGCRVVCRRPRVTEIDSTDPD